ncbi:hypothetical protein EYC98_17775 [Halieaceae bacterium IMCC14734]|uniref:Integrase n=1 Tax=Candidatus Litorirhabdus singularis TaxID=2518993 RepID=A0ABT3TLV2_9GAMM|nr:hypothetical protein [Candidatus Litorirhabdus singularis]MCX2982715.1 hypothetical protein [Candidatus Litorirhabdus singularis]
MTAERLKDLLVYIRSFKQPGEGAHFQNFIDEGFTLLDDATKWANIEQELYLFEAAEERTLTQRGGSILNGITNLAKTHSKNQDLWPPSRVVMLGTTINIAPMYTYPVNWIIDFKELADKILSGPGGGAKYRHSIHAMQASLSKSRFDPYVDDFVSGGQVLADALDDDNYFKILLSQTNRGDHSRLGNVRKLNNPKLHGNVAKHAQRNQHNLRAGSMSKGAFWVYQLSPKWYRQCQTYIDAVYKDKGELKAVSAITRLTKISSSMVDHKEHLPFLEDLNTHGIEAFLLHDADLLLAVYGIEDKRARDSFGEILRMYNTLHETSHRVHNFLKYTVSVPCDSGDDEYSNIDLSGIAEISSLLTQHIIDYAAYELGRIDGDVKAETTIFGQVTTIKAVFLNHLSHLDDTDMSLLSEYGIYALKMNNSKIFKRVRYSIREAFEKNILSVDSAKQYQSAISRLCKHYKLAEVKSYAVSAGKRERHKRTLSESDYYSIEDVASLAYAIELALCDRNLSLHDEQVLRLGRVLIKTGWNLAPVLTLEVDDILQLNTSSSSQARHFVRLFKKRADYETQFYEFEMSSDDLEKEGIVFGTEVTNALRDLKAIRDNFPSDIRGELPEKSKLKYRLPLYIDTKGKVRGFSFKNFTSKLNIILRRNECNIQFNCQRIRKGGLNYIYKQFSRNFKEYKKAGQHSLKVFLDVYLRDNGIRSEETLSSATSIMANYFTGRPISDDIIIVTDIPDDSKQTPSGRCTSQGNDAEAIAYLNTHKHLNKEVDNESPRCSDFNACLFCRHFRVIADAEHVWRLLSYKEYIVGEMQRAVSDYEEVTDQARYIDELEKRVDEILEDLAAINSDAISSGKQLMKTKGCHEDWALLAETG